MKAARGKSLVKRGLPLIEGLEGRRMLSAVLTGTTIHAETSEAFTAVLGNISGLASVSTVYTLHGSINWGDGSTASAATFVKQSDGSLAVEGSHTYAKTATDVTTITISEDPPAGMGLPSILVGTIKGQAQIITANSGVTLEESPGVSFTASVGTFPSNLSSKILSATINWGDGTTSQGTLVALPVASLIGRFSVVGTHTYAKVGSYPVHVTVIELVPVSTSVVTPPVIASFDSVVDVLPVPPVVGPILTGTALHAEATQAFTAVLGTISSLPAIPTGYTLKGLISWGDGMATSAATFVKQTDGTLAVQGSHTYAKAGSDAITITVTEVPPAGSTLPVKLIGTIHSTATAITPNGGVTLEETAGKSFTAGLGSFASSLTGVTFTATITWGDGTTSTGTILPEPAGTVLAGRYMVRGTHTYAKIGSYAVHITITAVPIVTGAVTPPIIILVGNFDSVIDVLPVAPVTVTPV